MDLYSWTTPNGFKPIILLEELGIPYRLIRVDIGAGEQKRPDYLAINPNGRIPALIDDDTTVFESGAILIHLAEKTGRFLPTSGLARARALSWLMFQMAGIGPMLGQLGFFRRAEEKVPMAIERYRAESARLLGVMESRLAAADWLADEYCIADIATFPWVSRAGMLDLELSDYPGVARWVDRIAARPAVRRALTRFDRD